MSVRLVLLVVPLVLSSLGCGGPADETTEEDATSESTSEALEGFGSCIKVGVTYHHKIGFPGWDDYFHGYFRERTPLSTKTTLFMQRAHSFAGGHVINHNPPATGIHRADIQHWGVNVGEGVSDDGHLCVRAYAKDPCSHHWISAPTHGWACIVGNGFNFTDKLETQ